MDRVAAPLFRWHKVVPSFCFRVARIAECVALPIRGNTVRACRNQLRRRPEIIPAIHEIERRSEENLSPQSPKPGSGLRLMCNTFHWMFLRTDQGWSI